MKNAQFYAKFVRLQFCPIQFCVYRNCFAKKEVCQKETEDLFNKQCLQKSNFRTCTKTICVATLHYLKEYRDY